MATRTRQDVDGALVEYRRHPFDPTTLHLEARVLKPDGTPHDDSWYRVKDDHFLRLGHYDPEFLKAFWDDGPTAL